MRKDGVMKRMQRLWLVAWIDLHWAIILWCRRWGEFLIRHGTPFRSKTLQKLSKKIDHHGLIAFRLQDQYDELFTLS